MRICGILLVSISMIYAFDHRFQQRSAVFRRLQDLLENEEQEASFARQYHRRIADDSHDEEEDYMVLRATSNGNGTNNGVEITLQNRAAMNTRLRVLYTDSNGNPAIVETGRLWAGQTKSVTLPAGAQHVIIIVEKDIFFESWREAYKGTLTNGSQCIRIVGVTFISKIHPCK